MEKILKLYTFVNGVNDAPFPNIGEQISISSFRYEAKRMGAAPTISCTIEYESCLDNEWNNDVYVIFRGEKYYLKQTPTSSYNNESVRYKHDVEFVSERSILDNVYFYDVVNEDETVDRVVSNSTSFSFSGDINEFVTRLNKSLSRLNVGYSIVADSGVSSDVKLVEFDNKFISNALQEIQNAYNLKYYFVGKEIHVGEQQNAISRTFRYGSTESLLSITKNNANAKIINRITGMGSSDNIPFYYPNDDEKGITRVLLNGYPNGVSISNTNKYRNVKSTDKFIFKSSAAYTVSLLNEAKRVQGSISFIGDPDEQRNGYDVDFYYQITLSQGENVRISATTDYEETKSLSYELIKTSGVNYGVNTEEKDFALTGGTYNLIVRWRFMVDVPFKSEEEVYPLIDEYLNISADIVVDSSNVWTLNNMPINLENYGITVASPKNNDVVTIDRISYIHPQKNLMPSIYRSSEGEEHFYNALNNTYSDNNGGYYIFENEYSSRHPHEHIETFDDIKPTIKNVKNNQGEYIDSFIDFAYDTNDNDDVDENNEFIHPYFYAKLRKFNGEYGFNLFDHAIENNEMVISMVSGSCASCEFPIMVDSNTQKNTVLVDDNGNLLRDANGNIRRGAPIDKQNDTINNEVWVALKKDINTYGVIMPNATNKYRPSVKDKFVILHIDLPKVYITQAEKRLEEELIKYMYDNNSEKFNFSISFSRIFFAENPTILDKLNENSKIKIEYNGIQHELYVSSFSYYVDSSNALPEVKIELADTLVISQNQIAKIVSATKKEILAKTEQHKTTTAEINKLSTSLESEIQNIKDELYKPRQDNKFLSNDRDDRSTGLISSDKGFEVGKYVQGVSGAIVQVDKNTNKTFAEVDSLHVRMKAYFDTLEVVESSSVGGKAILSPAGSVKLIGVEDRYVVTNENGEVISQTIWDYYRCYFLAEQDGESVANKFIVNDQAYSKTFNLTNNKYFWRLVIGTNGDNPVEYNGKLCHYIDLSKNDCDVNSDKPSTGDVVCQRGNRSDESRQNFIEFSSVENNAPYITLFQQVGQSYSVNEDGTTIELNPYSLDGKDIISFGYDSINGQAYMRVYGNMYIGARDESSFMRYTHEKGLELKCTLSVGTKLSDGRDLEETIKNATPEGLDKLVESVEDLSGKVDEFGTDLEAVKQQSDRQFTIWFFNHEPTLDNEPASDWNTQELKDEHNQDMFYYREAGKAWRFKEGQWKSITDQETIRALELIAATRKDVEDMSYLTKALKDANPTVIENGLVMTSVVAVQNHDGDVEAFINGSEFAEDEEHGKLLLACGIPPTGENLTERSKKALTRIYEDGTIISNKAKIEGEVTANSGSIGGFKISGRNLTNEGFSDSAAIIFKKDGNVSAIGSNVIPIESGANGAALFQCHTEDKERVRKNYGLIVSSSGTGENIAIGIDGGYIEGLAMKNRIVSSNTTLSRLDTNIIVTASSECTITLPEMQLNDDGHVIRIKRIGSGAVNIAYQRCYNFSAGSGYTFPVLLYDRGSYKTNGDSIALPSSFDACEFVWVRDLVYNNYVGAWIQYKMPSAW